MVRIGFVISGFIACLGLLPVIGIPFQIITLITGLAKLRAGDKRGARGLIICGFVGVVLTVLFIVIPFDGTPPSGHWRWF
jgi:uncharacterized membrane protein HdeD (DUF308 family)